MLLARRYSTSLPDRHSNQARKRAVARGKHTNGLPRIGESPAGRWLWAGLVQALWYIRGGAALWYIWDCAEEFAASTWAVGAAAATTAELTAIDPAALSARIAGMMMDCLIRTIPPWHRRRSAACCTPHQLAGAAEL